MSRLVGCQVAGDPGAQLDQLSGIVGGILGQKGADDAEPVRRPLYHAQQPDVGAATFAAEFDARQRHEHGSVVGPTEARGRNQGGVGSSQVM